MKNLFNDISKEEKNRILEMHSDRDNVISEQPSISGAVDWVKDKVKSLTPRYHDVSPDFYKGHPATSKLWKMLEDEVNGDGPLIKKETPNQLIIDGLGGTWTITLTK
jgi:hypothetical protein